MKYIGAHVSASGGVANAAIRAAEIGALNLKPPAKSTISVRGKFCRTTAI